jgi:hypothetical protein
MKTRMGEPYFTIDLYRPTWALIMRLTENNDCARDAAKIDIALCFWESKIKVLMAAAIEFGFVLVTSPVS